MPFMSGEVVEPGDEESHQADHRVDGADDQRQHLGYRHPPTRDRPPVRAGGAIGNHRSTSSGRRPIAARSTGLPTAYRSKPPGPTLAWYSGERSETDWESGCSRGRDENGSDAAVVLVLEQFIA